VSVRAPQAEALRGLTVVVTGGCGFIGSHLAATLSAHCNVVVVDNLASGSRERIAGLPVRLVQRSVLEPIDDAFWGADVVFHLAAQTSLQTSLCDPIGDATTNVLGTIAVFDRARRMGIRRLVYASSSAVYADSPLPCREDSRPGPVTPYGAAKASAEVYGAVLSHASSLETVGLRLFNVYGPGQSTTGPDAGVVAVFAARALAGQGVTIHGDGGQTRDFIYVTDVVRAFIAAAETNGLGGRVFNVGTGVATSVSTLGLMVGARRLDHAPARTQDVKDNHADVALARSKLGFDAEVSLAAGISRLMALGRTASDLGGWGRRTAAI
jgi:UDP-glucose 4-epimerase